MNATKKASKNDAILDILSIFVFAAIFVILLSPAKYAGATNDGLILFGSKIVPTLLPFFFLTRLLLELGTAEKAAKFLTPVCRRIFNIEGVGAFIFLMGVFCGYPTGAKLTADYLETGKIDKAQAQRLGALVSTSGPMFVVGTVGAGFLADAKIGAVVFAAHILGALLNGIVFRKLGTKECSAQKVQPAQNIKTDTPIDQAKGRICACTSTLPRAPGTLAKSKVQSGATPECRVSPQQPKKHIGIIITDCAQNALSSILIVGVFIVLFFLFIEIFFSFVPIKGGAVFSIIAGLIEVTRGAVEVSRHVPSSYLACIILTLIISFGGLSVHLQSLVFLSRSRISYRLFFLQKITHAIFACMFAAVLALALI